MKPASRLGLSLQGVLRLFDLDDGRKTFPLVTPDVPILHEKLNKLLDMYGITVHTEKVVATRTACNLSAFATKG
jgi:hypothetical protein